MPVELFFEEDIRVVVEACIILHNMMVEERLSRDQEESSDWYHEPTISQEDGPEHPLAGDGEDAVVGRQPTPRERLDAVNARWPQNGAATEEHREEIRAAIDNHFEFLQGQFDDLYDRDGHQQLRFAIMHDISK
ncbi:expressed unknown protein [Seminavis robusta]|uniref:Uncharacterized protein n=1 Tax=Seminavis robusta TaxID=568900 RepID=A0A9N8HZ45_9STRA|nr:expressed unknown protein [Seminavis robusta]|eukprot:Sro3255_g345890.1 n/a (134) ;mRNA; f:3242-3643